MSATVRFCLAFCSASRKFGINIAAMMPMMATTINSSISVKPVCARLRFIRDPPPWVHTHPKGKARATNRETGKRLIIRRFSLLQIRLCGKKRQPCARSVSPARRTGIERQDPAHPLDSAVELRHGDPLVGPVNAARVLAGELEGGHAVGRDPALAKETAVGEARNEGGHHRALAPERTLQRLVETAGGRRRRGAPRPSRG